MAMVRNSSQLSEGGSAVVGDSGIGGGVDDSSSGGCRRVRIETSSTRLPGNPELEIYSVFDTIPPGGIVPNLTPLMSPVDSCSSNDILFTAVEV